jgi:hypothetical protein
MNVGLVTIVIGPKYTSLFEQYSRVRFDAYGRRHGYDTLIIDKPIRELPGKKLTWQKCCLHDLEWVREKDLIAFLDSDTLIAKDAPPIPLVEFGKIGGVMDKPPAGLNSGVLIFRPGKEVAAMFEESLLDLDPFWDQVALERVLRKNNALQLIEPRFHCMFYIRSCRFFSALFKRHWIYHSLHGKSKLAIIHRLLGIQRR